MTNDELLHKWVNRTITAEELEVFKLRPEYESLVDLYENTDSLEGPSWDKEAILADILGKPRATRQQETPQPTRRIFPSWIKYGIAASILLIGCLYAIMYDATDVIMHELAEGEFYDGNLPDKSTFALSENSTLSYDNKGWPQERVVQLAGEALFKVEKGSTFLVVTPAGNVQVVGTEFKVIAREGNLKVHCREGEVRVYSEQADNYKEKLEAGEYMELASNGESSTWKTDVTKLRKVTLKDVTESLSRTYKIAWDYGDVDISEQITCSFKNDNMEQALKTSLAPLRIHFEILEDNKIRLSK